MRQSEIVAAIGKRLQTLGKTIAWENKGASPDLPYLQVEFVPGAPIDPTLAGGRVSWPGFVYVYVNSGADAFATDGLDLAQQVIALFPFGLRVNAGLGMVLITRPPVLQQSYRDGANWRTPVRIDYQAA